jgi:hypothetical protein
LNYPRFLLQYSECRRPALRGCWPSTGSPRDGLGPSLTANFLEIDPSLTAEAGTDPGEGGDRAAADGRAVWCCPSTSQSENGRNGGACGPQTTTQNPNATARPSPNAADPAREAHPVPRRSEVLPRGRELQNQERSLAAAPPHDRSARAAEQVARRRSRCHVGLSCCLGGGSQRPRTLLVVAPPPRVTGLGLALVETRGGAYQHMVAPFTRWGAGECMSLGQLRGLREDSSHCGSSNP